MSTRRPLSLEGPLVRTGECPYPSKRRYRSKRRAKRDLARFSTQTARGHLHAYLCECGLWHIGHKQGSRKYVTVPRA